MSFNYKEKGPEKFITDIVDASTSKRGSFIYSTLKSDNLWKEVADAVQHKQLIILRLNTEYTVLPGLTKEEVILISRIGKEKNSYKMIEKQLNAVISIYKSKFWLRGYANVWGLILVSQYIVEYKFLIPESNRYFPSFEDIDQEQEFFSSIASKSTGSIKQLYKNIATALKYASENNVGLQKPVKCEADGYATIVLTFPNRICLDKFEHKFKHILIH